MERESRLWLIAVATAAGVVGTALVVALHAAGNSWTAAAAAPVPLACYALALVAIVRRIVELRGRRRFVLEQRLLTLASERAGRVHPAEVAIHLRISVAEAREMLDGLVLEGAASAYTLDGVSTRVYLVAGVAPVAAPRPRLNARPPQRPAIVDFSTSLPEISRRRGDSGRSFGDCRVRPRLRT